MADTTENPTPSTEVEVTNTATQASTPVEPISSVPADADAKEISQPSSSGASDKDANKKPTSLLDAVKSAATKADAKSSTAESNGQSETSGSETNPKVSLDETAKEKTKPDATEKVPFHNHPRWKEVVSERDALKPKADQFEKITNFMSSNGLSTQEVAEGFQIMALMKTNPAEAHKKISEYKAKLDIYVGDKLPDNIAKKVEEGFVDPESAKELAALKAEKELQAQRQVYAQEQYAIQAQSSMRNAVSGWEQQMKVKDPDWSTKEALITDRVRSLISSEQPATAEQAIALVERAYSQISDQLNRIAPKRTSMTPVRSSTSSASVNVAPKSLKEAVLRGLTT
jgi:hypothetical protein